MNRGTTVVFPRSIPILNAVRNRPASSVEHSFVVARNTFAAESSQVDAPAVYWGDVMNATLLSGSNAEGDDVERDELFGSLYPPDLPAWPDASCNRQGSFGELGVTDCPPPGRTSSNWRPAAHPSLPIEPASLPTPLV